VVQVFVTGGFFDGDLGGLAGADTICTNAAAAASLSGNWTAWLSDGTTNAIDRIDDGEYQLLDETVVAENKAELTDGTLDATINLTESQNTIGDGQNVWTATDSTGVETGGSCQGWSTNVDTQSGRIGETGGLDATWTDVGAGNACQNTNHLYCFEDVE